MTHVDSHGEILNMFMKMTLHVVILLLNFLVGEILGADGKNGVLKINTEGNCNYLDLHTNTCTKQNNPINKFRNISILINRSTASSLRKQPFYSRNK